MAKRTIAKSWEDFDGLDYKATDLTRDSKNAKTLQNCVSYKTNAWRKRFGKQLIGQTGNFLAHHNYAYTDDDGSLQQEYIAINDNLWKLNKATVSITGPANWGYQIANDTTTGQLTLKVFEGSTTPVAIDGVNTFYNLGSGREISPITVLDLVEKIDARSGYSIAVGFDRTARVNGNQTSNVINVDSGHSITAGDIISLYDYASERLVYRYVTSTTATSFTFHTSWPDVTVIDNQVIGEGAVPAATIQVRAGASEASPTQVVTWYYWEPVIAACAPHVYNYAIGTFPFTDHYTVPTSSFNRASFKNANGVCYITAPTNAVSGTNGLGGKLFKYDGQSVYRCGTPEIRTNGMGSAVGSIPAGTYRYVVIPKIVDYRGNECNNNWIYGTNVNGQNMEQVLGGLGSITQSIEWGISNTTSLGYKIRGGWLDVAVMVATNTFTLYRNDSVNLSHDFEIGDYVVFRAGTGALTRRKVTAVVKNALSGTVTIDGAATTAEQGFWSNDAYYEVYRTESTGSTYYYTASYPFPQRATTTNYTFLDDEPDPYSNATLSFEDVPKSKLSPLHVGGVDHNPKECKFLEIHQGILVTAGDSSNPESITWSEIGDLEYFPFPENIDDIPSNVQGQIKALASDTDENLYVSKDKGIYEVIGDLVTGAYNIRTVKEGDFGISSHESLAKVDGAIFGVGPLGLIIAEDGEIAKDYRISPRIWNSTLLSSFGTGSTDPVNRLYRLFIQDSVNINNSKEFVFDLINKRWGEFTYATKSLMPNGGCVVYPKDGYDELFTLNTYFDSDTYSYDYFGFVYREHGQNIPALTSGSLPASYLYWDHSDVIMQTWSPAWIHLGTPEKRKAWIESSFYHFVDSLESNVQPYPFTVTIYFYRDFKTVRTALHSVTVNSAAEWEKTFKAINQFSRAFRIEFANFTGGECMHINGVNFLIDDDYKVVSLK